MTSLCVCVYVVERIVSVCVPSRCNAIWLVNCVEQAWHYMCVTALCTPKPLCVHACIQIQEHREAVTLKIQTGVIQSPMKGQAASAGSARPPKATAKPPAPAAASATPAEEEEEKKPVMKKKKVQCTCTSTRHVHVYTCTMYMADLHVRCG